MKEMSFQNWQRFATFPCKGNTKTPATRNGFKDGQTGQDVQSFIDYGYNAALACAKSGLIVIDCDVDETKGYNGIKTKQQKEAELGELPRTLTQQTPRGGKHFIFSSKGICSPRGKIGNDVDIKYNGYIMIAPSSINGRAYNIIDGIDENGNFIIADLPEAWLNYLNKPSSVTEKSAKNELEKLPNKVYKDLDIEKMFKNCAFLQFCRDNAEDLPEPIWHSMITVLAQIEDSDELIHKLSEPYHCYNYTETQNKIDYARHFGHPQSCEYLSQNYSEICANCHSASKESGV